MRKNTVISFIGLLFCLCIQAQGTSTSVNSTVNDVDWARAEKFSSDALEQYIKGKRPYPNWIEGSSYFYYNVKEDNGVSYYLVNAKNGKKRNMIRITCNSYNNMQESRVTHSTQGIYSFTGIDLRRMTSTAFILIRKESLWCMICAPEY